MEDMDVADMQQEVEQTMWHLRDPKGDRYDFDHPDEEVGWLPVTSQVIQEQQQADEDSENEQQEDWSAANDVAQVYDTDHDGNAGWEPVHDDDDPLMDIDVNPDRLEAFHHMHVEGSDLPKEEVEEENTTSTGGRQSAATTITSAGSVAASQQGNVTQEAAAPQSTAAVVVAMPNLEAIDADDDGAIDHDELFDAVMFQVHKREPLPGAAAAAGGGGVLAKERSLRGALAKAYRARVAQVVAQVDRNHDGRISSDEFFAASPGGAAQPAPAQPLQKLWLAATAAA